MVNPDVRTVYVPCAVCHAEVRLAAPGNTVDAAVYCAACYRESVRPPEPVQNQTETIPSCGKAGWRERLRERAFYWFDQANEFPAPVDRIVLTEAIEIIDVTPEAEAAIRGVHVWSEQ